MAVVPDAAPQGLSFAADIRPLFRERDRASMLRFFDLWSHDDVLTHHAAIVARVRNGTMPCDGAWPLHQVAMLERWVDEGSPP